MAILEEAKSQRKQMRKAGRVDRLGIAQMRTNPKTIDRKHPHNGDGHAQSDPSMSHSDPEAIIADETQESTTLHEIRSEGLVPNLLPAGESDPPAAQFTRTDHQESPTQSEKGPMITTVKDKTLIAPKSPAAVTVKNRRPIPFEPSARLTITEPKELNDRERVLSWAKEHDRKRKAELDRTAPNPEEIPSGGEFSKRSEAGNKRNDKRLRIADESDADILGEFPCLTESLSGREGLNPVVTSVGTPQTFSHRHRLGQMTLASHRNGSFQQ